MNSAEAAQIVIETITTMAGEGRPLMKRVLPDEDVHFWEHYPKKDARDRDTKSRWYYHVHAPGQRDADEHGHFHLFLHRTQLPKGLEPQVWPPQGEDAKAHVTHIAGLSINHQGIPRAWFMTNRFVTNEFLYPADVMIDHLPDYMVDNTAEDDQVNQFLTAMVALYRNEIAELLHQRDKALIELVKEHGDAAFEKASGVEVLAQIPIDLDAKIETIDFD